MPLQHRDHDPCSTVHLPHVLETTTVARHAMQTELLAEGLPIAVVNDAEVVLSELVANACEHGKPDADGNVEISWCLYRGRLLLSVLDGGRTPRLRALPLTEDLLGGRGLAIVDAICDTWAHEHDNGTRVTAEFRLGLRGLTSPR